MKNVLYSLINPATNFITILLNEAMKRNLHEGDILYINNLNNLGRTYDDIIREWKYITKTLRADIVSLDRNELFDSRKFRKMGNIGKLMEDQFLALLSFVAPQERERIEKIRREESIWIDTPSF